MGEHDLSPAWSTAEPAAVSDELDLDKWIDGSCGLTRTAKIYQRGDLIARIDQLERDRDTAARLEKQLPKGERGLDERTADSIQREIDELSLEVVQSALTMHVQDRTEERRAKIRARLMKEMKVSADERLSFEDNETINIALIADAVIKVETPDGKVKAFPDGFPPNKLREMIRRLGDAALGDLWTAYRKVTMEAPQVSAPLSRRSSYEAGGIT